MTCADCGCPEVMARGICGPCWGRHRRNGTHVDFETKSLMRDDLLDEWDHWAKPDVSHNQRVRLFAAHIGRSYAAVDRALRRAGISATRAT